MNIKLLLIIGLFLPTCALSVDMPPNEIKEFSPEKKDNVYRCSGLRLREIGERSEKEAFNEYAFQYQLILILEKQIPYSKHLYSTMYEKFESELLSEPNIKKRKYSNSTKTVWNIPSDISDSYLYWASHFYSQKQRIEKKYADLSGTNIRSMKMLTCL